MKRKNDSIDNEDERDADLKDMTEAELRQEVLRLRKAFREELAHTGNHRCWITLMKPLPEYKGMRPLSLPRPEFLRNCSRYYDRNAKSNENHAP